MRINKPCYYEDFYCLCGDCPDTCCGNWCIVVDAETNSFYSKIPDELGERIRSHLTVDEEGETCLSFEASSCLMQNSDGLCSLQCAYGEQGLSKVCRMYPRFRYEFGATAELGLSLSCPEACRLILSNDFSILSEANNEPPSLNDIDAERYLAYLKGRSVVMKLAADRTRSLSERMILILLHSEQLERSAASGDNNSDIPELPAELLQKKRIPKDDYSKLKSQFAKMEYLSNDDNELLLASGFSPIPESDIGLERILEYYLYKYYLQSAYDGRLLKNVQFAVASVLMLHGLTQACSADEASRRIWRFSRETEHSDLNLEQFLSWAGRRKQGLFLRLLAKKELL